MNFQKFRKLKLSVIVHLLFLLLPQIKAEDESFFIDIDDKGNAIKKFKRGGRDGQGIVRVKTLRKQAKTESSSYHIFNLVMP